MHQHFAHSNIINSALGAGSAAAKAEGAKRAKYQSLYDHNFFVPMAFETSGILGPGMAKVLTQLGDRNAAAQEDRREVAWLFQQISITILGENPL